MERLLIWLLKKLKYSQKKRELRSEISAAVSCTNFERANKFSNKLDKLKLNTGLITDGYHTFEELYEHRCILFACLCNENKNAWKSLEHHDGTMFKDYFIVGIDTKQGQCTYHYHIDNWNLFNCKQLVKAPKYDGHTSNQAIERLKNEYL